MDDVSNFDFGDLFSGGFLVVLVVVGLALLILFLGALISIIGSSGLSGGEKLAWLAIVLFLQFIGPLLWFALGRRMADGLPRRA